MTPDPPSGTRNDISALDAEMLGCAMTCDHTSIPAVDSRSAVARPVLEATPNPSAGSFEVSYGLRRAEDVRVVMVDVAGRCVATLVCGRDGPGLRRAQWHGTGDDGRSIRPGVHFLQLRAGQRMASTSAVIAR